MTMSKMLKQLLKRFPKHEASFIFCTDEKIFIITPDEHAKRRSVRFHHGLKAWRQCQPSSACAHALRSATVMVSVAVSKLDCTQLVFVKHGAK